MSFNDSWPCFPTVDDYDPQPLIDCGMVSVPAPQMYQISYEPTSMHAFDYRYPIADLKLRKEMVKEAFVKLARSKSNREWLEGFIMSSLQKSKIAQDDSGATSTAITVAKLQPLQSSTLSINCNNNKDEEESEIKEAANLELDEDKKPDKNANLVLTAMSIEIEAVGTSQKDENEIQ
ncbi:hypothetical protein FRX31_035501 [Thalictrum thalictroides]|uniref:Uncharacterized protein n=1 Tax=Thalictrum thalictroides TaxID=46969 RepID=A0A7J6URN2_THATH|nr:hypothetical protein FRX31_035501 [Thalictrum thalictroides]